MLQFERWKIIFVLVLSVLGVLYAAPNVASQQAKAWLETNVSSWLPSSTVNLGLDLQGGSYLLLEADTKTVINDRLDSMVDSARTEMRKENIGYIDLTTKRDGLTFKLRNPAQDHDAAAKIARSLEQKAEVHIGDDGTVDVTLGDDALNDINTHVIEQSIEIVRRRIDETGTKEPVIQRQGTNRIVVELPGLDDPQRIKDLLGKTAKMTFHLLDTDADAATGAVPPGDKKLPMREDPGQFIIVKKHAVLTGDMLIDSQPTFDEGQPAVTQRFNAIGGKRFCDVTRENIGKRFAIVLDDQVISAPVIQSEICGNNGVINGLSTVKEANDLALLLRAGALPAPLNVVEERSVGPTLGSDSVASGKMAACFALLAVLILMGCSYGLFGIFADIALVLNMIFIFALLSILQATLTPGIAGIILTIGIAVDANVLIYERIREELRNGRTVLAAVDTGYKLALATIVDSNLTTLIVAIILFSFGSGPVKGFAVAMSIGIVTSLFAAIMLTRLMVVTWLRRTRPTTLSI